MRNLVISLGFIFVLIGCTQEDLTSIEEQNSVTTAEDTVQVSATNYKEKDFTYLEELSEEKVEIYKEFLQNGNIGVLSDFTPEEILLIYMNLVYEHNVDKLYLLTYNGGEFPTVDAFIEKFLEKYSWELDQTYLLFRNYDEIAINDATNEEVTIVHFKISLGKRTHFQTFPLKKEDGIWKLSIYR
ncbi:hypothetical protein UACE39S_02499 [Ureibacillus acetophenoni]